MAFDIDKKFEETGAVGGMTKEEAIYSLLWLAIAQDNKIDPREVSEGEFTFSGIIQAYSKTIKGANTVEKGKLIEQLEDLTSEWRRDADRWFTVARDACASLKKEGTKICKSVFVQIADIVWADAELNEYENEFIELVTPALGLDPEFKKRTMDVLEIKNDF